MSEEARTALLYARVKQSLRNAVDADRRAKGQSFVEWLERAVILALDQSEVKYRPQRRSSDGEGDRESAA